MKPSKTLWKEAIDMEIVFLTFILMLSIFLGFELITKVPATLHTRLMSGANAISGITVVGAISLAGTGQQDLANWLGAAAVALASINVVGGYMVTDRMLAMFKKKGGGQ
jgi:NAD(P) transhydrogenase subunit alpha